jgi:hypothetical protein
MKMMNRGFTVPASTISAAKNLLTSLTFLYRCITVFGEGKKGMINKKKIYRVFLK